MTSPTIITDASFSHDGNLLAVAFEEGRVQVCNVASGQIVGEPLHHGAPISSIQFSPDHRKILTSSYDRTARAWDALTGTPLIEPIQHGGFVSSARFSPNSHQVITTSWDGVVRLWEIQTGKTGSEILTAAGHIALSPDARKAASFSTNRIDFHELPSGQIFGRSLALTHPVNGLGFSDDGRYIAIFSNPTSDGGTWDLREVESGRKICRSPFKAVDIVFSSRAEKLAIVKKETVILCDAKTGRILKNRFPHHGIRTAIALSPDGK